MPALASPNPLAAERRVLRTRLSPAECVARLEAETVGVRGPIDRFIPTNQRLRGTVGQDGFRVRRFTPDYRNFGRPYVAGSLTPDGSGTRITLTFAPQIGFRIFSLAAIVAVVALTIVSVATGFIWSSMPINQRDAPVPVPWLLVILAALFVGGPYLLKRVGVSEGPWLLDFLMTLLDTRLVSDGDPAGEGVHS